MHGGALYVGGSQHGPDHDFGWSVTPKHFSGSGPVTYVIPVGAFFTGSVSRIGFIGDDDARGASNITYSNIRVYEPEASTSFAAGDFQPYGSQDGAGGLPTSVSLSGGGKVVTLAGNAWKIAPFTYNVKPTTILEVTLASSDMGEIVGISLDSDTSPLNQDGAGKKRLFTFGGSGQGDRNWRVKISPLLSSGDAPRTYQIPVGTHLTGSVSQLGIFADDDEDGSAVVSFSAIRLYEP